MKKVGVPLSPRTFNAILTGVKSLDESKDILDRMKNAGVTPDPATFNLLLTKAEKPRPNHRHLGRDGEGGRAA